MDSPAPALFNPLQPGRLALPTRIIMPPPARRASAEGDTDDPFLE
jgi:2,4-dienoyl-CoA reductase-like NADH-dependent reductase (Old Yellow Enzyme family)